jgi:hypothetical protein
VQPVRILLVQLGANGDCLFVTAIARQIKEIDYPGCHLTWMVGSLYTQALINNKYIDCILEIPLERKDLSAKREQIEELVLQAKEKQSFDKVFITDYTPVNYKYWFGSTRSSLFRCYPNKIKVDPRPDIFLDPSEQNNVAAFCERKKINNDSFNVLFECSPNSGQSLMDFNKAFLIAKAIAEVNPRTKIIMSSSISFQEPGPQIIDGSRLSWRENAELANYCQLLIGCSSGITWLCTSSWVKRIPMIQVIDPLYFNGRITASVKADYKFFGISTNDIIELYNPDDDLFLKVIHFCVNKEFIQAKKKFDQFDSKPFRETAFLIDSKLPLVQKISLLIKYHAHKAFLKLYRKIKPKWFTPKEWARHLISKQSKNKKN